MKDFIRETLRESVKKNALGVVVTKPNQELIIIRGITGAGKSTKAKSIVGKGVIHSTDDLIEKSGDYREFFANMVASGDFSPLSKMHAQNLNNAIQSMKSGVTPILIDNTNIRHNEPKAYVKAALEMGYDDDNIKFVDIGTAGLDAQQLADRNTHGVPLEKIKAMIDAHTSSGPLSLKSILDSKDMYNKPKVSYSAVVLDNKSHSDLLTEFGDLIPSGWNMYAHHMTITMGELSDKTDVGKEVELTVTELGMSEMAMAVRVTGYPSKNAIPHVTIAVNPDGGKPRMSNDITDWKPVKNFKIKGIVTELN